MKLLKGIVYLLLVTYFLSCKQEKKDNFTNVLNVRIPREPDLLNPVLSKTDLAATVENLLFLSIMEFDPYTQAPTAVLAESKATVIKKGKNTGYKLKIKKDATWDDGSPITADDVVFTLKSTINPFVESTGKRSVLLPIDSIERTADQKEFIFWTDDNYFLDEHSFTNNFILQESVYDSLHLLATLSWTSLKQLQDSDTASETARTAIQFAALFNNPVLNKEGATGAGPYQITEWISNQTIRLKKKNNWWGEKYRDSASSFIAMPDEIIYRIIPEESNVLLGLKEGLLDVASDLSPSVFKSMHDDSAISARIQFLEGPSNRFVYLALNTKSPLLSDVNTRKALAHLLDLDQLKSSLYQGYAERINAPFQPAKSYYDQSLKNIPFNINQAKSLLELAGWKDSNKNGIVDKNILNKIRDLKLRLYTSPGGLGQKVALHLLENAKQAGIEIELLAKPLPIILEQVHAHDFEIAALADVQYPGPDDPFPNWHSSSYSSDGQNITGFTNTVADSLIQVIRTSEAGTDRTALYKKLQQIIYNEQPVVFLFSPKTLLAVNKKWKARMASVRPGYFINEFELQENRK